MKRFYVFKDGTKLGSTATREQALRMIRQHQEMETHYLLRAGFSLIEGEEELIPYPSQREQSVKKRDMER